MDACPFRWQTKWLDTESDHYYFGYRHYDPRMGRWLSRDPLGETGGFNLYAYCGNDPVNYYDPLGKARRAHGAPANVAQVVDGAAMVKYLGFWGDEYWAPAEELDRSILFRNNPDGSLRVATTDEANAVGRAAWSGVWHSEVENVLKPGFTGGAAVMVAPLAVLAAPTAAATGQSLLYSRAAFSTGSWVMNGGIQTLGARAGMVAGAWVFSENMSGGNSFTGSLQAGAGTGLSIWTNTGYGTPQLDRLRMPSLPPWLNPRNYELVPCTALNNPGILGVGLPIRYNSPQKPPINPTVYSVEFEVQLKPHQWGLSEQQHYQICNEALRAARAAHPDLANLPLPTRWGRPPADWSWQHATIKEAGNRIGVMQLVPRSQHTPGSPFWRLFHPYPGAAGGYWEWAVPAGAPPR